MPLLRTDIIRALDQLIDDEAGTQFQALAVVLAKQKWPELIASEWHNDGGLDAYAPAILSEGKKARGVASSITATLTKIKGDAKRAKEHYQDLEVLIFVTPHKITVSTAKSWAEVILNEIGAELYVLSREDIITSLMLPENAALCSTLPGISLSLPVEQGEATLLAKVREAIAEEAKAWRTRQRVVNRPILSLNAVKLDRAGKETSEILKTAELRAALGECRRIALEAPAGAGKTTTLVQLATESPTDSELSFLIDLPAWIRYGVDILEFIARTRSFRARNISAGDLARLAERKHFSFLLNGWNEIGEVHSESAITALAELERSFPAAGIIVATRTHYISPPLPGAIRAKLQRLNRWQRADYLGRILDDRANDLRGQLEANRVLDDLTRTPLILAEVVTIFQSGDPIPDTRVGVLNAVMQLIEGAPEHRPHLQIPPLSNRANHYLTHLAATMTARGEVLIGEEDARGAVHEASASMLAKSRIYSSPDADAVLHALSAHHVLEQIDYPSVAFRFQHQQFQEFYAARFLAEALAALGQRDDDAASKEFAASYINMPMWDEPLRMVAEEIRHRTDGGTDQKTAADAGVRLVTMAMGVDPILAGDLARLCGLAVWDVVRNRVGMVLRDWYAIDQYHHRQLALAAMLATGSDAFADVLVPLLTHHDREVRVSTYEAGGAFYPTSLGADWRCIVDSWDEDARADFAFEVTHRGLIADIGESFAMKDPSAKVRHQAIQELSWISATDALTRVIDALDERGLEAALPSFLPESIPEPKRARFIAANRRILAQETTELDRVRRLLKGIEFGDSAIPADLMKELTALSPPLDQSAAHAIGEALKIIKEQDAVWVSTWVAARLLDGTLYGDHWYSYLLAVPQRRADDLVEQLASRELGYLVASGVRMVLTASATPELAAKVFDKLCDLQRTICADDPPPLIWRCLDQLHEILRAFPIDIAIAGILPSLGGAFDKISFKAVIDVFGGVNTDAEEVRSLIPEPLRQSMRDYLKNGIAIVVAENLLDDGVRSHCAMALGRIGDPADLADLRLLIDADIARYKAKPDRNTYSNWFVQALLWLDAPDADTILIDLLSEERYARDAASGLLQLATPPKHDEFVLGNKRRYEAIWAARAEELPPRWDAARSKR